MSGYRKNDGPNSEDKALDLFAEMMIKKIQSIDKDWTKPWFTENTLQWPKNMAGREYNGMNAFLLLMHCEENGYKIPRFCTLDTVQRMNKSEAKDEDGETLPRISVLKGEKSFPVMLTTFTCIDKDTKERIKYEDYKNLSEEEKKQYNVYPKLQVFRVFNVAQTNLQEARPELWAKLERENSQPIREEGDEYSFEPMDTIIKDNLWICPIRPMHQDHAYYSINKNEIVVPEKEQFKNGESYYGTLFHEMTHSTGKEGVLDRLKPTSFGSDDYAREELVAELGGALIAQRYGMTKNLKEDSCAYLKSWLDSLKESPQFIKTTLLDVKRATSLISQRIDKVAMELQQTVQENMSESIPTEEQPVFYSSVAYLQMSDDTRRLDELRDKGDFNTLLQEAREYDQRESFDLEQTHKSPTQYRGDDLLIEDEHHAVVYNNTVGGTYDVLRKVSEQDVRDAITRYGLPDKPSDDVKALADDMGITLEEELAERSGMHR